MSVLNIIWMWLKQIIMLPANLAKVTSINKDLELQKKLFETQQRLKEAENQLTKYTAIETGRMFFFQNAYWSKDANGKIENSPYCPRCFELNGKTVHLITWHQGIYRRAKCPECKANDFPIGKPE